ncbi:MAG: response regulator [Candidatus Margulisiibacteriota bacterium]|nr:MAG: hypothetical protein A2X43_01170 [Candidatus Margulisbacteria bacterium GWD2_39_127]OGI03331.1 MAG: hypothetical protein A2X42_06955 [Candidatus Margulisbacteria bacterium GWF2_38_17]OGI12015.1 MAG: hypothetical protein A2X41_03035 [Candidatus Margulisbacteria bacterium GWE2_39_32]PZM77038.1 MAG: response regulator [Candidatus Margulisiibacteriota bacterium]HAR63171.1 two-component system response regulator [Candidatus Margulisiibacteriota bacterium]
MKKKVLIIDDEMSIHSSLQFLFNQYNLDVLHASTAHEAIRILKETKPDLIFMDFKLPETNGIILTQKIHSHPEYKDIPIIGITAYATEDNRQFALNNGIKTILEKPFDLVELQKQINIYL